MQVSAVRNTYTSFKSAQHSGVKHQENGNPVSAAGEKAVLAKAGVIAGLGFGFRLLFELFDGGFAFEHIDKAANRIVSKQKNLTPAKRMIKEAGVFAGISLMIASGAAALYTLFKAPEINYQGNINAFKHKKDMDIYIKGNSAEKEIYAQMNEKAENGSREDKEKLRLQLAQMKAAKNQVPDFAV